MVSRKNQIYLDILRSVLPYVRAVQTWRLRRRLFLDLYPELDLVHNLYRLLEYDEFRKQDVYWINVEGAQFARAYRKKPRVVGPAVLGSIRELIALMPDHLGPLLTVDPELFECYAGGEPAPITKGEVSRS